MCIYTYIYIYLDLSSVVKKLCLFTNKNLPKARNVGGKKAQILYYTWKIQVYIYKYIYLYIYIYILKIYITQHISIYPSLTSKKKHHHWRSPRNACCAALREALDLKRWGKRASCITQKDPSSNPTDLYLLQVNPPKHGGLFQSKQGSFGF